MILGTMGAFKKIRLFIAFKKIKVEKVHVEALTNEQATHDGELDEAAAKYEQAIAARETIVEAHMGLAAVRAFQGKLKAVAKAHPGHTDILQRCIDRLMQP